MSGAAQPRVGDEQLRAALAALGLSEIGSTDPARPVDRGVLLGMLLALAEAMLHDPAGTRPGGMDSGYRWMLRTLAGGDRPAADRTSALLMQDRLHRSADALNGASGEDTLGLVAAAAPAMVAAANLLSLLHHAAPQPGLVTAAVTTAQANLEHARCGLDAVRERLRVDGFDL